MGKTGRKCDAPLPGPRRATKVSEVAVENHASDLELNSDCDSVYNYFNGDLNFLYKNRIYVDTI